MLNPVIYVKPLPEYQLQLKFKNGEEKVFDMRPYLETGIFKELKDLSLFKTVRISFDTVEWANEADIDPETLYSESVTLVKA
jgi:Protein of unknown function (DUF2442)